MRTSGWHQTPVSLLTDLQEFVHDHRLHDGMTAKATEPEPNGYRLTVDCAWVSCSSGGSARRKRTRTHPLGGAELTPHPAGGVGALKAQRRATDDASHMAHVSVPRAVSAHIDCGPCSLSARG